MFVSWGQYTVVGGWGPGWRAARCLLRRLRLLSHGCHACGVRCTQSMDYILAAHLCLLVQAEAERRLIQAALANPRNQRFVLIRQVHGLAMRCPSFCIG